MINRKFIYIAFNKPYGILSQFTSESPDDNLSVFGLPKNIYACGRLDKDSEGLLFLTNDGDLINRLLNPKFEKEKTYWAQVENIPSADSLKKLQAGIALKDFTTLPCKAKILDPVPVITERNPPIRSRLTIPTCWIEIKIKEGKNRQVRRMTAAIGCPTLRLIRKQIGNLELGALLPGEFKYISKEDIQ